MFAQIFPSLMAHSRLSSLQLPPATGAHRTRIEADAQDALRQGGAHMRLSERLGNPAQWLMIQHRRRESLLALLLAGPSAALMPAIVDLIAEISEESTWSQNPRGALFDDPTHPDIDCQCAETAVLFAWTAHLLRDRLEGSVLVRMYSEVRRRIFKPAAAYDDYEFMHGGCSYPMTIACDILLCAMLMESDEARQARVIRSTLAFLDEICGRHGHRLIPVEEAVMEITCITDLVNLLCDLTSGRVDLTARVPAGDWLDEILFPWIQDDCFNNPAGDSMHPKVSGSDIFRVGEAVKDGPLSALGALLYHRNHLSSRTVTGRILEGTICEALESTFAKPQPLRYSALRGNLLMTAQIPGLYCSMHVGGGRANAGDLCIFADGRPVLTDGGRACSIRNLPVIAGMDQLVSPQRPCIADFEEHDDRETMTVDLTGAYPAACTLRSYQRTALTMRAEQVIRLVDAVDMERPAPIQFRFLCACEPDLQKNGAVLGSLLMTWETDFSVRVSHVDANLYCLELQTPEPVRQGLFPFNFERI